MLWLFRLLFVRLGSLPSSRLYLRLLKHRCCICLPLDWLLFFRSFLLRLQPRAARRCFGFRFLVVRSCLVPSSTLFRPLLRTLVRSLGLCWLWFFRLTLRKCRCWWRWLRIQFGSGFLVVRNYFVPSSTLFRWLPHTLIPVRIPHWLRLSQRGLRLRLQPWVLFACYLVFRFLAVRRCLLPSSRLYYLRLHTCCSRWR